MRHWILILLDFNQNKVTIVDSLADVPVIQENHATPHSILRSLAVDPTNWEVTTHPRTPQRDGSSCGAFVCKYFEAILKNSTLLNIDSTTIRSDLKLLVLSNIDRVQYCIYCGRSSLSYQAACNICGQGICKNCHDFDANKKLFQEMCVICATYSL